MTILRPKPLNLFPPIEPKQLIKSMLEQSKQESEDPNFAPPWLDQSPLREVDPMSLDVLITRIDTEYLALGQVPDPKDIDKLVQHYWSMHDQFNYLQQQALTQKPRKAKEPAQSIQGTSISSLLGVKK